MKKILVAGSLNMDIVIKVDRFAKVGETIHGDEYFTAPGGKGANQAIAAARMGATVLMAGVLGTDAYGDQLLDNLLKNGVTADHISRKEGNTGTAFVTLDSQGSNSIVIIAGTNNDLTKEKINPLLKTIEKGDIALTQLESPISSVIHFLKTAKSKSAVTVLNPSPIQHVSTELLKHVDILVVNEVEAQTIAATNEKDEHSTLKTLLKNGISDVIMTVGDRGALHCNASGKITSHPTIKVTPVDTTAAGDAFIGGLLAALSQGHDFETAIRYGNVCGSLSTTRYGAQPSLPTKYEVEQKL